MRIRTWFTIVLILLQSGIVITALSVSVFIRLDQMINGDLYRFGLQFDNKWAGEYWAKARLMISLLAAAMIVTSIAIALFQFTAQSGEVAYPRLTNSLPLVVGIAMIALSAFIFTQIDQLIHNELYGYGLQFNYEWVGQQWWYARLMLGLLGSAILANVASIMLISKGPSMTKTRLLARGLILPPVDSAKMITLALLSAGIIALAFSLSLNSSVLAFTGLGLVFWGAILLYIRPEKYVKESLIAKATSSSLASLDEILRELGYENKGIYLPRNYLEASESSKVYMSARDDLALPAPEEIRNHKGRVFLDNPGSILITPPGTELARLIEETLNTSFTNVNLQHLEERLPSLLTEELQIAESFEIKNQNSYVYVKMKSSICRDMHKEAEVLPLSHIYYSLGSPLCSAIATALAETTGKPVIIEREFASEDDETYEIQYRLLHWPKEKA